MNVKADNKQARKVPAKPKLEILDYEVLGDGRVAGQRRKKGDIVQMTERMARYENVRPVEAKPAKKPEGASK